MIESNEQVEATTRALSPDVGACYGFAWRQMWKSFLELLLVGVVAFIISIPAWGTGELRGSFDEPPTIYMGLLAFAYTLLVVWPIEFGVAYAFLKAARNEKVEVKDMFEVFQNYGNAVLAYLLTSIIIVAGFFLLIIPGIVFACKLSFVPYLIVERKLDAIEAIKESWRMTTGHAMTVFLIGFLSFFILIAGLICFLVGVIVAIIWIQLTFAALYHAVDTSEKAKSMQVSTV